MGEVSEKKSWTERISEAEARGGREFTQEDKELARSWVTCACGQLDAELMDADGAPADPKLMNLGLEFTHWVERDAVDFAGMVLVEIQARARKLLEAQRDARD